MRRDDTRPDGTRPDGTRRDGTRRAGPDWTRPVGVAALLTPLLASLLVAPPVSGDLLVTRDGSQLETRGPWEVRGRLVVFTRPDGTLASIRLREVDLEASERATEAAAAAEEKASEEGTEGEEGSDETEAAPEREAAWVLTDADFTRRLIVEDDQEPDGDAEETADGASSEGDAGRPPVVVSYEPEYDLVDQHVKITGTLANKTRTTASAVSLEVSLFDEQGDLLEMRRAEVAETVLSPGAETSFEVDFPQVFGFAAVQFRPKSVNLETGESGEARIPGPEDATADELGTGETPPG